MHPWLLLHSMLYLLAATPTVFSVPLEERCLKPLPRIPSEAPLKNTSEIDLLGQLFPIKVIEKWTTLKGASGALILSDTTLHPHHVSSTPYNYLEFQGKTTLKAHYPKGSYKPSASPQGGISFYAPGPSSVDLSVAKEATFGYSVMFPAGFEFVKGGKLPGIYGGDDNEISVSCSGGRKDAMCFSARLMWREEGAGELYTYLPPYTDSRFAANEKQCGVPNSYCNPTYGASLQRGSFTFTPGKWTTVSQIVKLNTPGKADGALQLFVAGKKVIDIYGLILRDNERGRMRGIQMQTFFGGSSEDWATPKDQDVFFANFSVGIVSAL
ncbi:polysaccharide lyase family 14 protein [Lyophyllum atratum]|nr:polysaccharide lyase family 14 protein [Lyophyllum atratum]